MLDFITQFVERNGYEPSYQQIANKLGVTSKGGIQRHIEALEGQGLISRRRTNGSFGFEFASRESDGGPGGNVEIIELSDDGGRFLEERRWTTFLPAFVTGEPESGDMFGIRMPDDSLVGKQICEGDVLLFEQRSYGRRGEIVAASLTDGEIVIGRYQNHGQETEIGPANDHFESRTFPADAVSIFGVMRGLIRPPLNYSDHSE